MKQDNSHQDGVPMTAAIIFLSSVAVLVVVLGYVVLKTVGLL